VFVFIAAVPIRKLFALGEGDSGGHVLRETTSRSLYGLVCPSCTNERGGEGYCVKEGEGEEGEREGGRGLNGTPTTPLSRIHLFFRRAGGGGGNYYYY
jgi:hypothetical protein